jgi:ABC-type multidrug transport system permease subunit
METTQPRHSAASIILAAIPAIALTIGVPFANHLNPRVFGLPFILAYIVFWILVTPAFMWTVYVMERRKS